MFPMKGEAGEDLGLSLSQHGSRMGNCGLEPLQLVWFLLARLTARSGPAVDTNIRGLPASPL